MPDLAHPDVGGLSAPAEPGRYDFVTLSFHWLTAVLVVTLFALAQIWERLPRGTPLRLTLQNVHVSFGILLAAVILCRIAWRLTRGRHLPAVVSRPISLLATAVHLLLYALLCAQMVLGFLWRWAQGQSFTFFGLFPIPAAFAPDRGVSRTIAPLHDNVAWAIIIIAGGHAVMALLHHYVLKDGTLRRMLPERPV